MSTGRVVPCPFLALASGSRSWSFRASAPGSPVLVRSADEEPDAAPLRFPDLSHKVFHMARRIPLTISLTPQLDEYIAEEVSTGRYGTSSEVVRAALRLLQSARKREVRDRSPAAVSEKGGHRAIR